ncbi:GAP family protein [Conexibacter woesei]|uniref:Uncharacterized protein n=1 Tax=Conexibacter woesei (strain DSM 14684 / CCUG 47730 / CIP 108061 / JCM 11494 / NBRC 100937 / ID131577) TaxID=469383 RepID=D3F7D0_CONWI|nr:GAP family protein [Conexibacter woesei]ADB48901.1 hypothetical protein Cwoe_0465 [Conexibacter woesei DSM 14684]
MSAAVIGFALASAIRPTSVAAVYALLCSREPRRLLSVYIAAGFLFSAAFGFVVVGVLHTSLTPRSTPHALIDLILGVAALAFAAGVATGSVGRRRVADRPESGVVGRLRHPTPGVAAIAGVATHLPGLFYLAALADILAARPSVVEGVFDVLLYNAIWFGAAIGVLVRFVARPDDTRARVALLNSWAKRNGRSIVLVVFGVVGAYLVLKGVTELRS